MVDLEAIKCEKLWLSDRIRECQPDVPENVLMMVEPGNLAEIYFKLREGLESSETGVGEDFANGDDCKTALDAKLYNKSAKNRYKFEFARCGHKKAGIMALAFNRQSNTVDEYYFPKGSFKLEKIYILYKRDTHEPVGKYAKYLVKKHEWIYKQK